MLNEFIKYLEAQVGQPYVWGAQHTKLTPSTYVSIIERREEKVSNEKKAIAFCDKLWKAGAKELYATDCSGLGMYWLQNLKKIYSTDMNANSMMKTCTLKTGTPKKGYWLFRMDGDRASHIGYMIDDTYVIHAKGRAYGVVKEKYKPSYWHKMGIPKVFANEINGKTATATANGKFIFTRILQYGSRNEDVKELKKLLNAKIGSKLDINNKNFYSSTRAAVLKFQKSYFKDEDEWDGKAGPKTIKALGGEWRAV